VVIFKVSVVYCVQTKRQALLEIKRTSKEDKNFLEKTK
jgi:hypothetical protein